MTSSREQILLATCDLLENQGFHATGLNEIVRESGAPKGSLYYYFPQGKEEIVAEAVRFAGQRVIEHTKAHLAEVDDPASAVCSLMDTIAQHVETSGFRAGGPLTIVAAESATTSERINQACREAYSGLRKAFAARLVAGGWDESQAGALAWSITAIIEGAIVLSRTYHTGDPLREAAKQVARLLVK